MVSPCLIALDLGPVQQCQWFASRKRVESFNFSSHEVNSVMFTTKLVVRLLVAFRGSFPYNGTHIVVGILL